MAAVNVMANPRGKTYIVGDIHGCLSELKALLKKVNFRVGVDQLIHVGDLIAKGPQSLEAVAWCRKHRIPGVLGNHDEHMLRYARRLRAGEAWETIDTKWEHPKIARDLAPEDIDYMLSLPTHLRLPGAGPKGQDLLVVHAGVVPGVAVEDMAPHDIAYMRNILPDGRATASNDDGTPWFKCTCPNTHRPLY